MHACRKCRAWILEISGHMLHWVSRNVFRFLMGWSFKCLDVDRCLVMNPIRYLTGSKWNVPSTGVMRSHFPSLAAVFCTRWSFLSLFFLCVHTKTYTYRYIYKYIQENTFKYSIFKTLFAKYLMIFRHAVIMHLYLRYIKWLNIHVHIYTPWARRFCYI